MKFYKDTGCTCCSHLMYYRSPCCQAYILYLLSWAGSLWKTKGGIGKLVFFHVFFAANWQFGKAKWSLTVWFLINFGKLLVLQYTVVPVLQGQSGPKGRPNSGLSRQVASHERYNNMEKIAGGTCQKWPFKPGGLSLEWPLKTGTTVLKLAFQKRCCMVYMSNTFILMKTHQISTQAFRDA